MDRPYQYLSFVREGTTCVVRLAPLHYDDVMLDQLCTELARLLDEDGCRTLVLSLGPESPDCLYSVFLAKLIGLKKRLEHIGGTLVLTDLNLLQQQLLQATGLEKFFISYPDSDSALKALATAK